MKRKRKGTVFMALGLVLVIAAFALTAYNIRSERQASASSSLALDQLWAQIPEVIAPTPTPDPGQTGSAPDGDFPFSSAPEEPVIPDHVLNPDMEMPEQTVNGQAYIGVLDIPALKLTLPIISQWSYPALKISPCRYAGSAYSGGLVIAGHNYRAHFAELKKLPSGSLVTFTDVDGNLFTYEVVLIETLAPTAVEEMTGGGWDLSLFTCTANGLYRTTVRCRRTN